MIDSPRLLNSVKSTLLFLAQPMHPFLHLGLMMCDVPNDTAEDQLLQSDIHEFLAVLVRAVRAAIAEQGSHHSDVSNERTSHSLRQRDGTSGTLSRTRSADHRTERTG